MTNTGTDGPGWAWLRRGLPAGMFFVLALTATAASGTDNAAFVSYGNVPTLMLTGEKRTVTVTMRNTGTTTWETRVHKETVGSVLRTTRTIYLLDSIGDSWGVARERVTGSASPNETYPLLPGRAHRCDRDRRLGVRGGHEVHPRLGRGRPRPRGTGGR